MQHNKIISQWLMLGVAMLMIQVLLGGVTRLTGSGLSITEWKPIIGSLPPLNDADWNTTFDKYKTIAQYKELNNDFSLSDFKFIFFWEWLHRNWARFIAVVFLIPFAYFLFKGYLKKEDAPKLIALFLLGLAQGLIGWIMVASGLGSDNIYVSHIRLAVHFMSAMVLICAVYWVALSYLFPNKISFTTPKFKTITVVTLALLSVQLIYGCFMAGLKAASAAPTWPSINGTYFPTNILNDSLTAHPINIHFIHRMLAYIVLAVIIYWFIEARKQISLPPMYKLMPVLLVALQILLGIASVLYSPLLLRNSFGVFESFAQCHQLVAMLLLMSLVRVFAIGNAGK
jgi:cytochrome c oxidase assembly protein subunit 15